MISNLDDLSGKIPSLEENISVANQSVTEEDSIWLQNEVEVKVITETLKKSKNCDSLSSKSNEEVSKLNVRIFEKSMGR